MPYRQARPAFLGPILGDYVTRAVLAVLSTIFGLETVHHVHADDVAQMLMEAMSSRSIAKARRLLGYEPRYRSLEAVCEAVTWLLAHQVITI